MTSDSHQEHQKKHVKCFVNFNSLSKDYGTNNKRKYEEDDKTEDVEHPKQICECQEQHQCNDCGKKLSEETLRRHH